MPLVAPLPHDLPVVGAGGGHVGLAEGPGAVGVEEVLLRDAHGESPLRDGGWRSEGSAAAPVVPPCVRTGHGVASIDQARQSAGALSVAGCTMRA
ncbi:hypothetical protein BV882_28550 [Streptomyces sp. 46]|nr:hypothetical protein BV882_28550 [Streptomyces sp. 46]